MKLICTFSFVKPSTDGYIAIVLPKLRDFDDVMASLVSKEDIYRQPKPEGDTQHGATPT